MFPPLFLLLVPSYSVAFCVNSVPLYIKHMSFTTAHIPPFCYRFRRNSFSVNLLYDAKNGAWIQVSWKTAFILRICYEVGIIRFLIFAKFCKNFTRIWIRIINNNSKTYSINRPKDAIMTCIQKKKGTNICLERNKRTLANILARNGFENRLASQFEPINVTRFEASSNA